MMLMQRWTRDTLIAILFVNLLFGCQFGTKPVIKIGLIAPFEGELSHIGYQRLYGVKLALQEVNLTGGIAGYKIELVALNDYGDQHEAQAQIQELVIDPAVKAVVGQWDPVLFREAMAAYDTAHLAVVSPGKFTDLSALPATFHSSYQDLSHTPPTPEAKQAYLATVHLIQIIGQTISQYGKPIRSGVWHFSASENTF